MTGIYAEREYVRDGKITKMVVIELTDSRCVKHIFQVVPRFKVKIEVSDGDYTAGFILFDSDMSYLMEKSCAYFVAQTKASNEGVYPIEFDFLVGKKMIFTIDKGVKQTIKSDGSFRVKRVCLDAKIIEIFVAQSPYVTPVKATSQIIDVDSDEIADDVDFVTSLSC
ncbi:unnamed protein product [Trifolium pratense]|uniref:Uncharacterized protein n=1 Tax=Trifolium pratense TaxID=57577 RepID=A0ACB0M602_TRIPR|nr:unnamed protein product [Trifolium pratense]